MRWGCMSLGSSVREQADGEARVRWRSEGRAANKKQESSGRRRVVAKGRASLTGSRSGDMRGWTSQTVSNRTEREERGDWERLLR